MKVLSSAEAASLSSVMREGHELQSCVVMEPDTSSTTSLLQATQANIASAQSAVSGLFASGGTNFQTGFEKAFGLFRSSTEQKSNCKRVILFLTDGIAEDSATIDSVIQTRQAALGASNASIFTFSMGPGADKSKPQSIACANSGIHSAISSGVNPLNQMASYFKLLALSIDSTRARWSEVYDESFGLGRVSTVSQAIYSRESGKAVFTGVVSIRVRMAELAQYATESEVASTLVQLGAECPTYSTTTCQLQVLRSEAAGECPGMITAAECKSSGSVDEITACTSAGGGVNSMFCDPLSDTTQVASGGAASNEEVLCCAGCGPLSAGAIAGIVIGSIAGALILGAAVYFIFFASKGAAAASSSSSSSAVAKSSNNNAMPPSAYPPAPQPAAYPPAGSYSYPAGPQPSYGYGAPQGAGFYPPANAV